MTPTSKKAEFAGPIDFKGPAVDSDSRVKEHNDAPISVEAEWLERAEAQHEKMSASEAEFFTELKSRSKDTT